MLALIALLIFVLVALACLVSGLQLLTPAGQQRWWALARGEGRSWRELGFPGRVSVAALLAHRVSATSPLWKLSAGLAAVVLLVGAAFFGVLASLVVLASVS